MIIHHLNDKVIVVELPADADNVELHEEYGPNNVVTYHTGMGTEDYDMLHETLPPGNWSILSRGNECTEEMAKWIVHSYKTMLVGSDTMYFKNYATGGGMDTALQSWDSYLIANGIDKESLILKKE